MTDQLSQKRDYDFFLSRFVPNLLFCWVLFRRTLSTLILFPAVGEDPHQTGVLDMSLNCILCSDSSYVNVESVWYRFLAITPRTIQTLEWYYLWKSHPSIFTNPSPRVGYDTRSIFKRGLIGFNSEFSLP